MVPSIAVGSRVLSPVWAQDRKVLKFGFDMTDTTAKLPDLLPL